MSFSTDDVFPNYPLPIHQERTRISISVHQLSPILGITIAKIGVKALKQRTILFKLIGIARNRVPSV